MDPHQSTLRRNCNSWNAINRNQLHLQTAAGQLTWRLEKLLTSNTHLNLEHLTALLLLGVGAVLLTLEGHTEYALFLYGTLAGYAFKNGVHTNSAANPTAKESSATGQTNQKPSGAT